MRLDFTTAFYYIKLSCVCQGEILLFFGLFEGFIQGVSITLQHYHKANSKSCL